MCGHDVSRETTDVSRETTDVPRETTDDVSRETTDVSRETTDVPRETPNVPRETPNVPRETWAYIEPANPGYWVFWSGGVRWVSDEEQARWIAGSIESGTAWPWVLFPA